ncbi:MAG: hypothetical protein JSS95_01475 [Acidobacteria bacterium]|nr:hypothetical protein [Acidobacteriota bacterium]
MKMFSPKTQAPLSPADVDQLRAALEMERRIAEIVPPRRDRSIDSQLTTDFRKSIQQTERYISRLADLLCNSVAA